MAAIAVAPDGSLRVLDRNNNLSALAADGHVLWSAPVPAGAGIAIAADGTTIVYVSGAPPTWPSPQPGIGSVTAVDATGHALWRVNGRFLGGNPVIGGDGTVYLPGAPMVALRPNGTQLFALTAGTPLIAEAIGTDGTLYAGNQRSGAPIIALASPSGRAGSVVPNPAAMHSLISPLSMTTSFRTHGAAVVCPAPGRPCAPTSSLGSMVSFTLRSPSTVLFTVRRARDGRPVTHTAQRLLSGTTWEGVCQRDLPGLGVDLPTIADRKERSAAPWALHHHGTRERRPHRRPDTPGQLRHLELTEASDARQPRRMRGMARGAVGAGVSDHHHGLVCSHR